jgi:hypothetical protein
MLATHPKYVKIYINPNQYVVRKITYRDEHFPILQLDITSKKNRGHLIRNVSFES